MRRALRAIRAGMLIRWVRRVAPDAAPWRFDAATYGRFVGVHGGDGRELRDLFRDTGTAVHEEALLSDLLGDVGQDR